MDLIGMAKSLLSIKQDYPYHIDYKKLNENGYSRVTDEDFDIYIFEQTWGNTSGGFEGMGGSAITTLPTYVLIPTINYDECLVFFNGSFAYKVPYSREFMEDVANCNVVGRSKYTKYLNKI